MKGTKAKAKLPGGAVLQGVALDSGVQAQDGASKMQKYSSKKLGKNYRSMAAKSMVGKGAY